MFPAQDKPQIFPGQISNPLQNGPPPQLCSIQRPETRMSHLNPQLFEPNFHMAPQNLAQHASVPWMNGVVPPSQAGGFVAPQLTQQAQVGATANPQFKSPHTPTAKISQNEHIATPERNDPPPTAVQNTQQRESAKPPVNHTANSASEDSRSGTSTSTNPTSGSAPHQAQGKIIITLRSPVFDMPFVFPSSNEGWNVFLAERRQLNADYEPCPPDLHSRVSNGNFELHILNPTFRNGFKFQEAMNKSSTPINEVRSPLMTINTIGTSLILPRKLLSMRSLAIQDTRRRLQIKEQPRQLRASRQ
jgi:hypothetical protein